MTSKEKLGKMVEDFDKKFTESSMPEFLVVYDWLYSYATNWKKVDWIRAWRKLDAHMVKKYQMRLF